MLISERAKKGMIDYARERAVAILKIAHTVVLATTGPAGLQASEFPDWCSDNDIHSGGNLPPALFLLAWQAKIGVTP